jgi:predicted GNAT family acetyltransferase
VDREHAIADVDRLDRDGRRAGVGGVFVPPPLRGQGRAGRVVASVLADARRNGAGLAVLFAASPGAATAYERIGFARCGDFGVALLHEPQTLGNPA